MKPKAQGKLTEKVIENADVEDLLEKRWAAKQDLKPLLDAFKLAHANAQAGLEKLTLVDGTEYRIGRFPIIRLLQEARSVNFDIESKRRISIRKPVENGSGD